MKARRAEPLRGHNRTQEAFSNDHQSSLTDRTLWQGLLPLTSTEVARQSIPGITIETITRALRTGSYRNKQRVYPMNTMVGLQASLHNKMHDKESELTKSDSELPLSVNGIDDDDFSDFDPEELLKSALFNNSNNNLNGSMASMGEEDSFGTFGDDSKPTVTLSGSNEFEGSYGTQRGSCAQTQESGYSQPSTQSFSVLLRTASAATVTTPSFAPSYEMHQSTPQRSVHEEQYNAYQMQQQQHLTQSTKNVMQETRPAEVVIQHNSGRRVSSMSESDMYKNSPMLNEQANVPMERSSPTRSHSEASAYQMQNPMQVTSKNNSYEMQQMQQTGSSLLELQQIQQRMRQENMNTNNNDSFGLSQSMHGTSQRRNNVSFMMGNGGVTNVSLQHQHQQLGGGSMHGTPCSPPFASLQGGGSNVSIASENTSNKASSNSLGAGAPLGEAMEKLCESMKRSAMSRNMVKQLSGRSLVKQGSGRQLVPRQNSGLMVRQGSNRSLMHQGSQRSLVHQSSQRSLIKQGSNRSLVDDGSGRGTPTAVPIRRMSNTKHQLQHPQRGVFRHNSVQSLNSQSNHGLSLQVDGRNMGPF